MADYAKLKNAELETLLKERNLVTGGKKADMVARLQAHDQNASSSTAVAAPPALAVDEDEINWDDDDDVAASKAATTEPAEAAMAAGGVERAPNPQAVPNQEAAIDPSSTAELSVAQDVSSSTAAPLAESKPPPQDFTSNLPASTLEVELEKRKARAAKFGIAESDSDAIRAIERAMRFGTGTGSEQAAATKVGVSGLDEALPERRARGPKRVREGGEGEEANWEDDGLIKRGRFSGGRGGRRGRGGVSKPSGPPRWMDADQRRKYDARAAKFGAQSG